MATQQPQDRFEEYFADKLWHALPAFVRDDDLNAQPPGVLRSLLTLMAEQAANLRRSHDRLWEDLFIESCDDWVVPYLAQMVATRLLSSANSRGRRIDVAKTIYYRRRKGTPRVLEELISDIAGWEGKLVEAFRYINRFRHNLDPISSAGQWSSTPQGGTANLRSPLAASLSEGPFNEYSHTPDVRRHKGTMGRFNLSKLQFFLYRIPAYRVNKVTPFKHDPADGSLHYSFDPSGRDIPLFMPRQRPEQWDEWTSAQIWDVPSPLPCQLLGNAIYQLTTSGIETLEAPPTNLPPNAADALRTLVGLTFPNETRLNQFLLSFQIPELADPAVQKAIREVSLAADCGKSRLWNSAIQLNDVTDSAQPPPPDYMVPPVEVATSSLTTWVNPVPLPEVQWIVDPATARMQFFPGVVPTVNADAMTATYYIGSAGRVGAGSYSRVHVESVDLTVPIQGGGNALQSLGWNPQEVVQVEDSLTYNGVADIASLEDITFQSANLERPYISLEQDWIIEGTGNAVLMLDGLWFGATGSYNVILRGEFEKVVLRHCSFDPGGGTNIAGTAIESVPLSVEGTIETLVIESCVMASIRLATTPTIGVLETLQIQNSVVDSLSPTNVAIEAKTSKGVLSQATIFGTSELQQLQASDSIFAGDVLVEDNQQGCFRFSAAPETNSKLPPRYRSHEIIDVNSLFTSVTFGHPGYAQISQNAPEPIRQGAENGSSMGALSDNLDAIKEQDLHIKVDEYMPFGLVPLFVKET